MAEKRKELLFFTYGGNLLYRDVDGNPKENYTCSGKSVFALFIAG